LHPVHNLWTVFFLRGWDGIPAGHRVIWRTAGLSGEFRYPLTDDREKRSGNGANDRKGVCIKRL
jgi:hypothetical protein